MALDRSEIVQIAHEAAKAAVAETFLTLGVDTTTPGSVLEVQRDFDFVRRQRESGIAFKRGMKKIGWGALATVVLSLVTWGLTALHLPAPPSAP